MLFFQKTNELAKALATGRRITFLKFIG